MMGSHNFACYVINTVGLEDIGCRLYFYKLLVSFKQKIYENSVRKSAEQIPVRVLQWFSQIQFVCFGLTKSTIVYCTISRSLSVNCTVYLSLNLEYCYKSR